MYKKNVMCAVLDNEVLFEHNLLEFSYAESLNKTNWFYMA